MNSATKPVILILCTGNSCRSQMAEGILRAAAGDLFEVHSAGSHPAGRVHPTAIAVMREIGIDLAGHTSKPLDAFLSRRIDTVITVCDQAERACPAFPGPVRRHHWSFPDPALATGADDGGLAEFRRIRDDIRRVFEAFAAGYRQAHAGVRS